MPRDERFSARDKKTHKMTKDGLIERNETTGDEQRISQRGQDFQMKQNQPDSQNLSGRSAPAGRSLRQQLRPQQEQARSGSPDDSPNDASAPQSLLDTAQPSSHSRDAPAEASPDNRRSTKNQRKLVQQERLPTDAPINAPNSLDTPIAPARRDPAPNLDFTTQMADILPSARMINGTPDTPALAADMPVLTTNLPTADNSRSRLQFGEGERQSESKSIPKQHDTRYALRFTESRTGMEFEPPAQSSSSASPQGNTTVEVSSGADPQKAANPKFQFSAEELPPETLGKKLTNARRKAESIDGKLDKAQEKLPTRRRIRVDRSADPATGKATRSLKFEKEVKTQRQHLKGHAPLRPVKTAGNAAIGYGHKKMFEVEDENVATKAAHRTEMAAEGAARSAYRFTKTRPYRKVSRLQQKSKKANINLSYRQAVHDNPKLQSSALSRFIQKQKIKRQYAKAAREAKRAGTTVQKAGTLAAKASQAVAGFLRRHPAVTAGLLVLLLMVFIIMTMFSSCSNMAGGGFSAVFMSSYLAEDRDINDAELAYTQWETDLQMQVNNAESTYPGFDEYRYSVDDIGHNPFELMAYLTAKYQDFTFAQVEAELRAIFAEQYTLTFTEEVEIRYRTEYYYDDEGELQSEEVPYNWYILNIDLTSRSFTSIVTGLLDSDQWEHYNLLLETKGNRQYTLSPFDFDWLPYVSSYFGYRVHPITGAGDYHKAIDIAVAEGTEILATHDGTVQTATWNDSYGWYIALETITDSGNTLVTKYAHCSELLVSAGQTVSKGDIIAKVGSTGTSTGAHLHFEVIVNGEYLNPLFFSEGAVGGTAAPGTPGGPTYSEYPGAPMEDAAFAAMMEEAQKHLGKPYVFGASGPNAFDCSGFVSYVLANSTHPGFGRTNAQGIYNQCTPVSPSEAQPGDLIFFSGTYSTPNACSHIGIYIGNGQMIHAGNPISYTSINTSYWQDHFYAFARLN